MQSEYMHWAKNQPPARYNLASSEVPHVSLDPWVKDIASLELDGASRHRYPALREAIAAKCGVDPACVVMADGTSMANMLAMAALIEPGDEVLIEHPAYEPLVAAASFLGAKVRRFERQNPPRAPLGEGDHAQHGGGVAGAAGGPPPLAGEDLPLSPAAIAAALTPATRLIILTNLHNPSSALAPPETLLEIGALAARAGARVLVDEVYLDAATTPQRSAALLSDTFITTSSLTKAHGLSGLRCGWILAAPDLAERIWRLNELFAVAQPHPTERLALIALANLAEIDAANTAHLAHNRALANAFFPSRADLEVAPLTHGITAFPRLIGGDVHRLHALLRDRHDTSIVPGRFFGAPDHFRVGIGGEPAVVEAGLARLAKGLDDVR
ncbi:MAG: aminotransferase class I/II-fold pyridoxal phosphate-dependent enzyme [Sphingomonadaceae bacterium]|nr:aminotransferase class I/II-fold pyridoxal phosphate-dependent enzyme [Sphingomonadaceae bacterium]